MSDMRVRLPSVLFTLLVCAVGGVGAWFIPGAAPGIGVALTTLAIAAVVEHDSCRSMP